MSGIKVNVTIDAEHLKRLSDAAIACIVSFQQFVQVVQETPRHLGTTQPKQ